LEGNFLPEGNLGLWKEIWKEIAFGRKLRGNIVIRREMRRKIYFISQFQRIRQFSYNFVQKKTLKMPFPTI
jgi:hypothetical protein